MAHLNPATTESGTQVGCQPPTTANAEVPTPPADRAKQKRVCADKGCGRNEACGHKRCDFPGAGE